MKCYICNKELTDVVTDKNTQCKSHGEHILHNAIGGHLISHTILCEECSGAFSQEDSAFVDIFATFLALLDKGDKLLLDRGRASNKSLKGQLFYYPSHSINSLARHISTTARFYIVTLTYSVRSSIMCSSMVIIKARM